MLKFSLIFIGFIVCMALIFRGAILVMAKIISKHVEEYHRIARLIVRTRKPPKSWIYKLEKKMIFLERTPAKPAKILKMEKRAKSICLKRICKLITYFETATLVKDKKTTEILLSDLHKMHRLWQEKDWKEIMTSCSCHLA